MTIDDFYDFVFPEIDESEFDEAIVKITEGEYGGVNVTVYTVNGPVNEYEYKDVRIYVYSGLYILHKEGKVVYDGTTYDAAATAKIRV